MSRRPIRKRANSTRSVSHPDASRHGVGARQQMAGQSPTLQLLSGCGDMEREAPRQDGLTLRVHPAGRG